MQLGLVLLALSAFSLALVLVTVVGNAILGGSARRDAKRRNRHNRAGDPWASFDREWMTPRQEQPR